jgi:hypothetical protein
VEHGRGTVGSGVRDVDCMACVANLALTAYAPHRRETVRDPDTGITHATCSLRVQGVEYRACELRWNVEDAYWNIADARPVLR